MKTERDLFHEDGIERLLAALPASERHDPKRVAEVRAVWERLQAARGRRGYSGAGLSGVADLSPQDGDRVSYGHGTVTRRPRGVKAVGQMTETGR